MNRIRYVVLVMAVVGAASTMVPAAVISPGSITLTSPTREQATRGDVEISWTWRSGKVVKSTSKVDLAVTQNGYSWYTIAVGLPIRTGEGSWSTGTWLDGVYAVRATVSRTTIKSIVSPMFVDNTAPEVRISRPAEGEVLVENERTAFFAAVVGTARLEAEAHDDLTGIAKVRWLLDDVEIGATNPHTYNFSKVPGRHILLAEATDGAGNTDTHSITLIVAPGPSASDGAVPDPDELPAPDPSNPPDPSSLPIPDPGELPVPIPSGPPTAPEPGDLPLPEGIPTP